MAAFVNTIFFSIKPSGLDVKEGITVILKIMQQIKPVTFFQAAERPVTTA